MKKAFWTGLLILLPIGITLFIVDFVVNSFTRPFIFASEHVPSFFLKPLILLGLFLFVLLVGFIAHRFLFNRLVFLNRIPLYRLLSETVETMLTSSRRSFSKVVLVPFPRENTYVIGFVSESNKESVFIPATPNPTVGFLVKPTKTIPAQLTVNEAFTFLVSFGVVVEKD